MMLARFTSTSAAIIKNVVRRPNSSRIRSCKPFPVTAPMREHISCVTISKSVIGSNVHSGKYPQRAPACEYVRIPPASLSTMAVMKPGPRTPRNVMIGYRSRFHIPRRVSLCVHSFAPEHGNNVVRRDYANELALIVHDRQRQQVVLVEKLGDAILPLIGRRIDKGFHG